jgi:hypothetical protein
MVLRRIFGPKYKQLTRGWETFSNEEYKQEVHNFSSTRYYKNDQIAEIGIDGECRKYWKAEKYLQKFCRQIRDHFKGHA